MYSGSRGILYTAPPGPDDANETEADVDAPTAAEDGTAIPSETPENVAADD